eukprot:scaffold207658_cov30-Tisochrysis_lutea.AAC.2
MAREHERGALVGRHESVEREAAPRDVRWALRLAMPHVHTPNLDDSFALLPNRIVEGLERTKLLFKAPLAYGGAPQGPFGNNASLARCRAKQRELPKI